MPEERSIVVINAEENKGFSGGNNIGIRYSLYNNCEYILLLNNDTVVGKNFIPPLINAMTRDPAAGIAGGKIIDYFI